MKIIHSYIVGSETGVDSRTLFPKTSFNSVMLALHVFHIYPLAGKK